MGLPLTWVTLNLLHIYWIEESARLSNIPIPRTIETTRICGDDLVAHWSIDQINAYEKLVL